MPPVIDKDSSLRWSITLNLLIYSFLGAIGILMGTFFSVYFFISQRQSELLFKSFLFIYNHIGLYIEKEAR